LIGEGFAIHTETGSDHDGGAGARPVAEDFLELEEVW
jgi:hypothetical protein